MSLFVGGWCNTRTMNDYDDVEVITKNKCVECGDKLTPFESSLCIICEAVNE